MRTILVLVLTLGAAPVFAEVSHDMVDRAMEKASVVMQQMSGFDATDENSAMRKKAEDVKKQYDSKENQERLKRETARVKELLASGDDTGTWGMPDQPSSLLDEDERIYMFISSSIPMSTLRTYAADLDVLADPRVKMVMRGFKGGMTEIGPTVEFLNAVIKKDASCDHKKVECEGFAVQIDVDPRLYGMYGVDAVPAVVYARGVTLREGEGKGCGMEESVNHYKVLGDAKMSYLLEVINREAKSRNLAKVIKKLKGDYYGE